MGFQYLLSMILELAFFQKSLALKKQFTLIVRKNIDMKLRKGIVTICDNMWIGQVFNAFYLVVFFSILRISNLDPHKIAAFFL